MNQFLTGEISDGQSDAFKSRHKLGAPGAIITMARRRATTPFRFIAVFLPRFIGAEEGDSPSPLTKAWHLRKACQYNLPK
jgi:hypothetical protein